MAGKAREPAASAEEAKEAGQREVWEEGEGSPEARDAACEAMRKWMRDNGGGDAEGYTELATLPQYPEGKALVASRVRQSVSQR